MKCAFQFFLVAALALANQLPQGALAQNVIQPISYEQQNWFIPPHVGGDRDFKGHGPTVRLDVRLYIHPQTLNEVWAEVKMDALETKNDWTRAAGTRHVKVATFARPITAITSPTSLPYTFQYTDTDHSVDIFYNPCACGLLNEVHFVGDMEGREAGTRTGVALKFNPILAR